MGHRRLSKERGRAASGTNVSKRHVKAKPLSSTLSEDVETLSAKTKRQKGSESARRESGETSGNLNEARFIRFRETNLLHYLDGFARGDKSTMRLRKNCTGHVAEGISLWETEPLRSELLLSARITALCWHPRSPDLLAVGSKTGEILLYDKSDPGNCLRGPPLGSGSSIAAMKFHWDHSYLMYSANLFGTVMLHDLEQLDNKTFWDTASQDIWFTALDICPNRTVVLAGDNVGKMYAFAPDGQRLWRSPVRLHKGKVKHIEFSQKDPNLLVTASVDHTVKLWDVRKLSCMGDALHTLHHDRGLNSAYFNPANGRSLLVTDQHSELRVYRGPFWDDATIISHPHRQFQHLTAIQATWHPFDDIIVVGRYPDNSFLRNDVRGVDLYDGNTGQMLYKIKSSLNLGGIIVLNYFNCTGDRLASAMGSRVVTLEAPREE